MFTGIIEEIGIVKEIKVGASDALIKIGCDKVLAQGEYGTKIGDSIAIDGVCQTVTELGSDYFCAQVSKETLSVTNFSKYKSGQKVNLERALALIQRLGGHIVSGHVDGQAMVTKISKQNDFYTVVFEIEDKLCKYVATKGSVAVNGISLTVADENAGRFETAIIPHTFENTNLCELKVGDFVNLETDILAKYVEKILSTNNNTIINEDFLKENGFF